MNNTWPAWRGEDIPPMLKLVSFLISIPDTTVQGDSRTWSLVRFEGTDLPAPVTLITNLTTASWPQFVRQNSAIVDDQTDEDSALKLISVHVWETLSSALDRGQNLAAITIELDGARGVLA